MIVADVDSIPRSQLDLLAARGSGSDFALMLFPLVRRIDLPVNGVALIEELIERCERNILRLTPSNCAKTQRRAGNRCHLRQHVFWVVSHECRDLDCFHAADLRRKRPVSPRIVQTLVTQFTPKYHRPIHRSEEHTSELQSLAY